MKKNLLTFFCVSAVLFFIPASVQAGDYWINLGDTALSAVMPVVPGNSTYTSVVQEIYFASELRAAGAPSAGGNITAITFRYGGKSGTTAVNAQTRGIQIYLKEIDASVDGFDINSSDHKLFFKAPGSKVFEGELKTRATGSGKTDTARLVLNTPFAWNGTDNILLTVYDTTNTGFSDANLRFVLTAPTSNNTARFVHIHQTESRATSDFSNFRPSNLAGQKGEIFGTGTSASSDAGQIDKHKWVNKVLFTIVTPIPAPENLSASSITTSSARLSWDAVTGATSYNVRWGTTSGSLSESAEGVTNTYLDIDELEDGTTYYFDVQTVTSEGTSAFASEVSFETTAITHEHNNITFSKWSSTTSMPLSGNYYLANDVEISSLSNVTLTGNLNLCLNGHNILTSSNCIIVPDGVTFALYDNEGSGVIRGAYPGGLAESGLISIKDGGTLNISEGSVVNLANDANDYNLAIDNKGTLLLSGAPTISGVKADIYLANSKVITINGALTNTTPYSVNSAGQVITSGWSANMGDANPSTHFTSAKSGFSGVCVNGSGEVQLVRVCSFDGTVNNNSTISSNLDQLVNVTLANRDITSASYNTLCLPFALSDAQLQSVFGSDYDLEEFTGSSVNGEELDLSFDKVTSLTAGQPYLIQPSEDVSDPTFTGVTISATSPVDQTSDTYVSFHGVFAPTNLEADNRNLLFLGAANTLFWPNETAPINGFRAYFEIKSSAAQAAKRARIVNRTDEPTAIDQTAATAQPAKRLVNGQLLIDFNGKTYNAQGILIK